MSRSYRKPCFSDLYRNGTKVKRPASKTVRRVPLEDLPGGNQYKKYYCSYDIHDYKYVRYYKYKHMRTGWGTEQEFDEMMAKIKRK